MESENMLVDSHCHLDQLDLTQYQGHLNLALAAAKDFGVEHFLCVCIDLEKFPQVLAIAESYPHVTASVGVHPNVQDITEPSIDELVKIAGHQKIVAIGETGLDYFRSEGDLDWQRARFRTHIEAAKAIKKPLIVHTRNAPEDTIQILRQCNADQVGGVMHCFTESLAIAKQAIDLNFYISFSGIVTFKKADTLQDVAKKIPLDRMLLETDSPYLAPTPHRGKANQPAYVRYVAECIAQLRNIEVTDVADQTTKNFFRIFTHASSQ
jgi:TatD DNase family protein